MQAREIDAFRLYEERVVPADPARVIEGSRRVLRRRMFRVARDDDGRPALAAEKGALREVGSLLFHWAFLLIVIGVIYGKGTGFTGRAVVVEGKTWIDAQANYDGQLRTGRFFSGDFTGVGLHLRGFEDTYRRTGQPMDFVSHVDLLDPQGDVVRQADIRVNEPASIDGVEFFQYGFGWAPGRRGPPGRRRRSPPSPSCSSRTRRPRASRSSRCRGAASSSCRRSIRRWV